MTIAQRELEILRVKTASGYSKLNEELDHHIQTEVVATVQAILEESLKEEVVAHLAELSIEKPRRSGYYIRSLGTQYGHIPHLAVPKLRRDTCGQTAQGEAVALGHGDHDVEGARGAGPVVDRSNPHAIRRLADVDILISRTRGRGGLQRTAFGPSGATVEDTQINIRDIGAGSGDIQIEGAAGLEGVGPFVRVRADKGQGHAGHALRAEGTDRRGHDAVHVQADLAIHRAHRALILVGFGVEHVRCALQGAQGVGKDHVNLGSAEEHVVLQEGCLLYTSPSPRDRTRSRMPSSA